MAVFEVQLGGAISIEVPDSLAEAWYSGRYHMTETRERLEEYVSAAVERHIEASRRDSNGRHPLYRWSRLTRRPVTR
jgi:hypothetical protein